MLHYKLFLVVFTILVVISCSKEEKATINISKNKINKKVDSDTAIDSTKQEELGKDSALVVDDYTEDKGDKEEVITSKVQNRRKLKDDFWGNYKVQVFAGNVLENAHKYQKKIIENTEYPSVILEYQGYYKVFVGNFSSRGEADKVATELDERFSKIEKAFKVYFGENIKNDCKIIEK